MRLKNILYPKQIVESNVKVGNMYMVHGYPLLKGLFPGKYYKIDSIDGDDVTLKQVNQQGKEDNFTGAPVTHKLSSIEASVQSIGDGDSNGIELVESTTPSDIVKDLDKAKNDLLKKVDMLIAKKKKLYSNVDIESPMSADEKKLDKDIADLFSQINKLVLQKRKAKNENMIKLVDLLTEAKFPVYHYSYTSAINSALEWAEKQGFEYDPEETADKIGLGPKKPSEGKTNRFSISLTKGGKEQRKMLHIQVYNMGTFKRDNSDGSKIRSMHGGQTTYELNCYIG